MLALLALCLATAASGAEILSPLVSLSGCSLPTIDTSDNPPILSNEFGKIYPQTSVNGGILVNIGSKFNVSCAPETNVLRNNGMQETECQATGLRVSSSLQNLAFGGLSCSSQLSETVTKGEACFDNKNVGISIEFRTLTGVFPVIDLCFDDVNLNTIMSNHSLYGGAIASADKSNNRPSFQSAKLYPRSPATAYTQSSQLNVIKSLVKSSTLASQYINPSQSLYFARGHLSPDGDFIYVSEQNATYYYVNVIPQWQAINNGNWKALEFAVRNLAAQTQSTYQIYTGGYGVLQLRDINGTLVDIYLSKNGDKPALPAPKLSWKIIHDPAKKSAVAVVVVNNPHELEITPDYIICEDICKDISWVKWDTTSIRKGYTYCCSVSSFKNAVPYAPDLEGIESTNLV